MLYLAPQYERDEECETSALGLRTLPVSLRSSFNAFLAIRCVTNLSNVRRKKTRCPGEKPCCSFCARLGQECTYYAPISGTDAHHTSRSSDMELRIDGIEDKLDRLIDHMR